ncbi:MAG TPA: VWA domain-containing protein [Deltaproteobacteria bacterium]|nr:VWA domain-containing protein [Deltaproteobacteria bacterium]
MIGFPDGLGDFHFLRPLWLLLVPILLAFGAWARRRERTIQPGAGVIADHLLAALTVDRATRRRIRPSDFMIAAAGLCALAAAGPAWRPAESPFFRERAPIVVALETTASMLETDVAPTRLERARQKILDLLDLRTGARTGLVAYAGSAHEVVPPTDDPTLLKNFLEGLEPAIMPLAGDETAEAIGLARTMLEGEPLRGTVVLVTDGIPGSQRASLLSDKAGDAPDLAVLMVGRRGTEPDTPAGTLSRRELEELGIPTIRATVDRSDVERLVRRIRSNRLRVGDDGIPRYRDEGHWLVSVAAVIGLLWFRRGFTMQWAVLVFLCVGLARPVPAHAEGGLVGVWLTPDQQGRLLLERGDAAGAARRFQDPMWRGIAAYRAGDFEAAAEAFRSVETADGAFNLGTTLIRLREFDRALEAYDHALSLDPGHLPARVNRERVERILALLEEMREDSDTGGKLEADELRFDLDEGEGKRVEIDEATRIDPDSAEEWMRLVETRTRDFLEMRFAIDLQHRQAEKE